MLLLTALVWDTAYGDRCLVPRVTGRFKSLPSLFSAAVRSDRAGGRSASARERSGQSVGDPTTQELARSFHLDDADDAQIVEKRGDANRLGFALQLTTVRVVGTFLEDPTAVPLAVIATMSRQLGIDPTTDLATSRREIAFC